MKLLFLAVLICPLLAISIAGEKPKETPAASTSPSPSPSPSPSSPSPSRPPMGQLLKTTKNEKTDSPRRQRFDSEGKPYHIGKNGHRIRDHVDKINDLK